MTKTSLENNSNTATATVNTPDEALQRLVAGNARFTSGMRSVESMLSHSKMEGLASRGQNPFAIVLTCSDSRSPAEMIFDQGIGDLFVVRVAGNVVAPSLLASIEFAAANFESRIVMVLGHTKCGAIGATIKHVQEPSVQLPSPHLEELVARIRPAIMKASASTKMEDPDFVNSATSENVRRSMRLILEQSAIVRSYVEAGTLAIKGAVLDIQTGQVKLLES